VVQMRTAISVTTGKFEPIAAYCNLHWVVCCETRQLGDAAIAKTRVQAAACPEVKQGIITLGRHLKLFLQHLYVA